MLKRSGQVDVVGEDQIFKHKGDAIAAIYSRLDPDICRACTARVFRECHTALPDGTPRPPDNPAQPRDAGGGPPLAA